MTDGIIQKVYIKILLDCGGHTDTIISLQEFRDELIEEIKKDWRNMTLTKMIGDNK